MKKTILVFGLISGAISAILVSITVPFADRIGFDKAEYLGDTVIVLSMLMVFFGVRSYRDNVGNGYITFGKGFAIGILITVISCVCYAIMWDILYFFFLPDHLNKYAAYMVEKLKASGQSPAAIQIQLERLKKYKALYDNPFISTALAFIEPFPVGLLITLFTAAVLRRKPQRVEVAAGPS
ncbi:MAG TPA: DUF4199 domain-containing protein [Candidatus Solibacter sp.]|nr:DUF4199 domain-containing protein [Candidatus Solibacter sp.]